MAQVISSDTIDFAAYMAETEARQKVRPAREWFAEMVENLGKPRQEARSFLPWNKTHAHFAFRPGEVTLWAGVNGHGKSQVTGLSALSLVAQGQRVCIASFEMKPSRTLDRMTRQFSGARLPDGSLSDRALLHAYREVFEQLAAYTDGRLWLYDQQGTVATKTILGVMRYAAYELRCQHFVVDSLMKCVRGEDDYNGQKDFVDELTAIARDSGMHVHLVHHLRKLGSEGDTPDKSDVKGSGAITDQVDNLLLVWRNKPKERDRQAGKRIDDTMPDAMLICDKQRNGEWEGRVALWFDPESQQYTPSSARAQLDYARWPHEP